MLKRMLMLAAWWAASPALAADLAVLHFDPRNGQAIALPVLHLPHTMSAPTEGPVDRQNLLSEAMQAAIQACAPPGIDAAEAMSLHCPLPLTLVASHHGLPAAPAAWLDPTGRLHIVQGGLYFREASGDGVGFVLSDGARALGAGTVLTTGRPARLLQPRAVPQAVWRAWPELTDAVRTWAREYARDCQPAASCQPHRQLEADLARPRGQAVEYGLPGGGRLQVLRASTRPRPAPQDKTVRVFAVIDLWRWQGQDGRARRMTGDAQQLNSIELENDRCETQCQHRWDGPIEVVEYGGRVFAVGATTGGTTHGYLILEVLPGEIRQLGGYTWGS